MLFDQFHKSDLNVSYLRTATVWESMYDRKDFGWDIIRLKLQVRYPGHAPQFRDKSVLISLSNLPRALRRRCLTFAVLAWLRTYSSRDMFGERNGFTENHKPCVLSVQLRKLGDDPRYRG